MKAVASSVTVAMRHRWHLGEVCRVSRMAPPVSDVIQDVYSLGDVTQQKHQPTHNILLLVWSVQMLVIIYFDIFQKEMG